VQRTAKRLAAIIDRARPVLGAIPDPAAPLLSGGWSAKQVVGHLIDSASNNHQRFVRAALEGELSWPGYDQNGCVRVEAFQEAPWPMLVEVWTAGNRLLVHILEHLPPETAQAPCRIGEAPPMSLRELAESYVSHLEHHLAQLGMELG
jgi:hypothetical protein